MSWYCSHCGVVPIVSRETLCGCCERKNGLCQCGRPRRPGQRYCLSCHAAWMRENRVPYKDLTTLQRKKANARSMAHVYRDRGKIEREPCGKCGDPKAEMHHPDYDKPLQVEWLCRHCHLGGHAAEAK